MWKGLFPRSAFATSSELQQKVGKENVTVDPDTSLIRQETPGALRCTLGWVQALFPEQKALNLDLGKVSLVGKRRQGRKLAKHQDLYHRGDLCSLSLCTGWLCANLTHVRAILEEETSTEKMLP